jgi:hypothetical protein
MSKEQYVTFEVARLLKEKGFDWFTYSYYTKDDVDKEPYFGMENLCPDNWNGQAAEVNDLWFSAPTQQMAMRWLREEKGIHIYPIPVTGFYYVVSVYLEDGNKVHNRILSRSGRHAYEDVVDAALAYCLTNLI